MALAHAVHPADALGQHGGVPGQVHVDHGGGGVLQVQPGAAGVGGQEQPAAGVVVEAVDQRAALGRRHAAMEEHMAPAARGQPPHQHLVRAQPLAEHHRLGIRLAEQLVQHGHQLVGLQAMVGGLVDQPGAVAHHAHGLQRTLQAALVGVGQEAGLAPALHDAADGGGLVVVDGALRIGQRQHQGLVHPLGQLRQHLGLAATQQQRRQRGADGVQPTVAHHAAGLVGLLVFQQQAPGRAQAVLVHQLHDRDQLFQPVLQRRAGQHQHMRAHGGVGQALQAAGGLGGPVLHPLGFVDDQQLGRPGFGQVGITHQGFVVDDLAERLGRPLHLACRPQALQHLHLLPVAPGESRDLALPLVLQRRGAHHQHLAHAEVPRQQLGRGDGLHGLAQAHLVADQQPAGAGGTQCAFGLVGVQPGAQQLLQLGAGRALGVGLGQHLAAVVGITHLGHQGQGVVMQHQWVACLGTQGLGLAGEGGQVVHPVPGQHATGVHQEQRRRQAQQVGRAALAGAESHAALRALVQPQCTVRGLPAALQGGLGPAPLQQLAEHELDVLAGAQLVGGVVGTGAGAAARLGAADGHAVAAVGGRVDHLEVTEHRVAAQVGPLEILRPAELAAQGPLPVFGRHGWWAALARQRRLGRGGPGCRRLA